MDSKKINTDPLAPDTIGEGLKILELIVVEDTFYLKTPSTENEYNVFNCRDLDKLDIDLEDATKGIIRGVRNYVSIKS